MVFFDPLHIRKRVLRVICAAATFFCLVIFIASYHALVRNTAASPYIRTLHAPDTRRVALTFDDGPHPIYTRQIADILERNHAPAVFFFLGSAMLENPSIAGQIHSRGFTIGNHTFTHSNRVHSSEWRFSMELNATETIIYEQTGAYPVFYRPPFLLDIWSTLLPTNDIAAVGWAEKKGYQTVGITIDSFDWTAKTPEDIIKIIETDLDANTAGKTHIILLHDDKKLTAEALEDIIGMLRSKGYEIVPLEDITGVTASAKKTDPASIFSTAVVYGSMRVFSDTTRAAQYIFIFALGAFVIRVFAVFTLFFISNKRKRFSVSQPFSGFISVLVPAYNEEQNLESALESIMKNTRLPDEIVVIDDASRDNTHKAIESVRKRFPDIMRVVVFLENKGKASALNAAIREARGDIFIAIDGDTILHPEAIDYITRPFSHKRYGGVAGKIAVARPHNTLTRFQSIEYEVAQNIEKRAFDAIGITSVIPGALGAWRRSAVCAVGGYETDTLVEDQDLTIAILRSGYHVAYEPRAIAYTEAPSTIRSFYKQRFRWTYGTFQCLWKHKSWLSTPQRDWRAVVFYINNSLFSTMTPTISLLAEISMAANILTGSWENFAVQFIAFQTLDMCYAVLGAGSWRK
ncbi:MAG: glycosyltransferase, partial [Patescibacteria group bacterium]